MTSDPQLLDALRDLVELRTSIDDAVERLRAFPWPGEEPGVTLTLRDAAAPGVARRMLDEVHAALVAAGVPAADRFQRVLELSTASTVAGP